jgi:octaprenyl-diphosphate synthase
MITDSNMDIKKIKKNIEPELNVLNDFLKESVSSNYWVLNKITSYMLKKKGKQLRPMFVFLLAKIFGQTDMQRAVKAATLIELLHTATLVHDDVVDDADYRRGLFSIKGLWKNKMAVLTGDFILSRGMLLALESKEYDMLDVVSKAVRKMSEGELLQLERSRRLNLDESVYEQIIKEKTASLIAACCEMGALSAGATQEERRRMWDMGEHIGMAFQIKDDILDFSSASTGKIKAGDIKEQKLSLPFIHVINKSSWAKRRKLINIIKKDYSNKAKVDWLINTVLEDGGCEYAEALMEKHLSAAQNILASCNDSQAKEDLEGLITYVSQRKY